MLDDAELLRQWAQGDRACGERLYRRHHRLVFAFFRSKLHAEVDDLVQATFVTALERGPHYRGGSVRAFLVGIARFELLEHLRRRSKRDARIEPAVSTMRDFATGVSTAVRRERDRQRLHLALESLPIDQQIALELRYWHGLSMVEIAEVQEVATATVRTRIHRAREALEAKLGTAELGPAPDLDPRGEDPDGQ